MLLPLDNRKLAGCYYKHEEVVVSALERINFLSRVLSLNYHLQFGARLTLLGSQILSSVFDHIPNPDTDISLWNHGFLPIVRWQLIQFRRYTPCNKRSDTV